MTWEKNGILYLKKTLKVKKDQVNQSDNNTITHSEEIWKVQILPISATGMELKSFVSLTRYYRLPTWDFARMSSLFYALIYLKELCLKFVES